MKTLAKILFVLTILISSYSCGDSTEDPTPQILINQNDTTTIIDYVNDVRKFDGSQIISIKSSDDSYYTITTNVGSFIIKSYDLDKYDSREGVRKIVKCLEYHGKRLNYKYVIRYFNGTTDIELPFIELISYKLN